MGTFSMDLLKWGQNASKIFCWTAIGLLWGAQLRVNTYALADA